MEKTIDVSVARKVVLGIEKIDLARLYKTQKSSHYISTELLRILLQHGLIKEKTIFKIFDRKLRHIARHCYDSNDTHFPEAIRYAVQVGEFNEDEVCKIRIQNPISFLEKRSMDLPKKLLHLLQ